MPRTFYTQSILDAVNAYPQPDAFFHWRSKESKYAAKHLKDKVTEIRHDGTSDQCEKAREVELRKIVNFLLNGDHPPEHKPPELRKLKEGGRLYTLLRQAERGLTHKKLSEYNGTTFGMAQDPDAADLIGLAIRQKYDAAIENWCAQNPGGAGLFWQNTQDSELISLAGLQRHEHLEVIDRIWQEIIEFHDVLHDAKRCRMAMVDPPDNRGHAFLSSNFLEHAFAYHGYAFRCDSRVPENVQRQGFRRAWAMGCPDSIKDTLPYRAANGIGMSPAMGMWKKNRDAVNQMTISVARQMRGCTKFPSADDEGVYYIYALGIAPYKRGFDTEAWQMTKDVGALWRPGEKAFFDIEPSEVLASVQISKLKAREGQDELWRFQFLSHQWTWHHASDQQMRHLKQELEALYHGGEVQAVGKDQDFYVGLQLRPEQAVAAKPVVSSKVKCEICGDMFSKGLLAVHMQKCRGIKKTS